MSAVSFTSQLFFSKIIKKKMKNPSSGSTSTYECCFRHSRRPSAALTTINGIPFFLGYYIALYFFVQYEKKKLQFIAGGVLFEVESKTGSHQRIGILYFRVNGDFLVSHLCMWVAERGRHKWPS